MSKERDIKSVLKGMIGTSYTQPITCEVVSIQGNSCTVKLESGLELTDVRLRATLAQGSDELLITPKQGSTALVWSVTGELDDLVLLKCDQIEKIGYKQDGLEFEINSLS